MKSGTAGAAGVDVRFHGRRGNLLGAGTMGVGPSRRLLEPWCRLAHLDMACQWNGESVLAGDLSTGQKGDLPDQLGFAAGVDVSLGKRLCGPRPAGPAGHRFPRLTTVTFRPGQPIGV
jgi:hypothetical protein